MNALAKTGKLLIIFISVTIFFLFAASILLQDKITSVIISSLNKNVASNIEADKVKLSFLRNFPQGSVELRNVLVSSSTTSPESYFIPDTLLFAQSFFLEFRPLEALRGVYNITSVDVRTGTLNLFTDLAGNVNYEILSGGKTTGKREPVNVNLEKISIHNVHTEYTDKKRNIAVSGEIKSGKIKGNISGSDFDLSSEGTLYISSLSVSELNFDNPFDASARLLMQNTDQGLKISEGTLLIGDIKLTLEGTVDKQNNPDLLIKTSDSDISEVMDLFPSAFMGKISEYRTGGSLSVDCSVRGASGRIMMIGDFSITKGALSKDSYDLIHDMSADGLFTTDFQKMQVLELAGIRAGIGNSDVAGSVKINDFINYPVDAHLTGTFYPADIKDVFRYENITLSGGSAKFDLQFSERIVFSKIKPEEFFLLKPEGTIDLVSVSLGLRKPGFEVTDATGRLVLSEIITAQNLNLTYEGQRIAVNGNFRNLPEWISGKQVTFVAGGNLHFNRLLPEVFLNDKEDDKATAVRFPADLVLDLNIEADNVTYKNFSAGDVKGSLSYKPKILSFNNLSMKSLDGDISGNGFIVQNSNKSIISKGGFVLKSIDVKKAFTTFNNFGQDFIVASNLSGNLSGSVSVLLPMDSLFRTSARTITAEGDYSLQNGALINFGPVKELSDFIELTELENIHFQTLENDFYIRNNILFIPQMDVRSSAADIAVNGKHSFDNTYEYHVRVLLSQILSKKRKTIRKPITEFGAVQDDGLGRTSLLLKIESKGEDVKVGYDIKAVGNEVKQGIREEKENLKTILNEEYGLYKEEENQAPVTKTANKKKFEITWSETDSIPQENIESEEKPRTGLFRKR